MMGQTWSVTDELYILLEDDDEGYTRDVQDQGGSDDDDDDDYASPWR